jgi:hypothetical protein
MAKEASDGTSETDDDNEGDGQWRRTKRTTGMTTHAGLEEMRDGGRGDRRLVDEGLGCPVATTTICGGGKGFGALLYRHHFVRNRSVCAQAMPMSRLYVTAAAIHFASCKHSHLMIRASKVTRVRHSTSTHGLQFTFNSWLLRVRTQLPRGMATPKRFIMPVEGG